jgi:hypothetical protein
LLLSVALGSVPVDFQTGGSGIDQQKAQEVGHRVQALNGELVTASKEDLVRYTPRRIATITKEIHELLTEFLLSQINHPGKIPGRLLAESMSLIQGEYVLPPDVTNTPFVLTASLAGDPVYISAYLIYRGGVGMPDTKAVIQAFSRRGGGYMVHGEAGAIFDRHGLFIVPVQAHLPGEIWFLAYGVRLGDNASRLDVVLYSFDGSNLMRIWEKRHLARGEVEIIPQGLELRYMDQVRYKKAQPPYFRIERYKFAEDGLVPIEASPNSANRNARQED